MSGGELPYHIVVGMPALSPTMDSGALAEWYLKEGDSFSAGDSLAKIETDKASIDFEAQDDGCIAKLLVGEGDGVDIPVGKPIMITVEEEEDIAAFKDYVHVAEEEAPAAAVEEAAPAPPAPEPTPEPAAAAAPEPATVEAPVAAAVAPPPPPPAPAAAPPAPPAVGSSISWGVLAKVNSPIAKTLGKQQQAYVDLYGTTGQATL